MSQVRPADGIEVSAQEARFLRRFVRRELLPWLAGVAMLAGLALVSTLMSPRPVSPAAAPVAERVAAETSGLHADVFASLRAENASLRADLLALQRAVEAVRGAPAGGSEADSRRAEERARALEARVSRLESAPGPRLASVTREAAGDTTSAPLADLHSIHERLYNLEARQDRKDQEGAALQQDVLARLFSLERSSGSEAAARLENLNSGEQRFEKLEQRLIQIEQNRGASSAPAAPAGSP